MGSVLEVRFLWVPSALGGHSAEPYLGMRLTIRWQRYVEASLTRARDVECVEVVFDPVQSQGVAKLRLFSGDPLPLGWLEEGELVELLSGYRVLAIGRILTIPS